MVRVIRKLRIDSVDHVVKGAGHECVALLRKADDAALADMIEQVRREMPGVDESDARMFARARLRAARKGLSQMKDEQMRKVVTEEENEMLTSMLNDMSPALRRRLRELVDEAERQERSTLVTGSTRDVHGNSGQGELSVAERRLYGKRDSLRKIADDYGLMTLCKHLIEAGSSGFDESEFAAAVQDYATKKGVPVLKLWAGDSEESRAICTAASACRRGSYARQAAADMLAVRMRAAQVN